MNLCRFAAATSPEVRIGLIDTGSCAVGPWIVVGHTEVEARQNPVAVV